MGFKLKDASSPTVINLSVMIFVQYMGTQATPWRVVFDVQPTLDVPAWHGQEPGWYACAYAYDTNVFMQGVLSLPTLSFNSHVDSIPTQYMANSQIY
jgi:hypothetical protein